MSTNVENSVELASPRDHIGQLVRVRPQGLLLFQEGLRDGVGLEHLHRVRVQRGLAALGRGDGQGDLVVEDFMGVSEFGLESVSFSSISSVCVCATNAGYSSETNSFRDRAGLTKNQPVGPWPGSWLWEVRTTRTLGVIVR